MKLFHSKPSASHSNTQRRGAAVVEFALVCPILALVLLGMIELSRGIMVKVILSDAARKGCRAGIQPNKGNADIIQDCTDIMRDNNLDSIKFNPNSVRSIRITVTDPNTGKSVNGNESLDAPSGSIVSIQVSIPISSTTWVPSVFLAQGSLESETIVMMKQ